MREYTREEYIDRFGEQAWEDKVASVNEGAEVESVYATDTGGIFMIINKGE